MEEKLDTSSYETGLKNAMEISEDAKNYVTGMQDWVSDMRQAAESGFLDVAERMKIVGSDTILYYNEGIYDNYDELDETLGGIEGDIEEEFSGLEYEMQTNGSNAIEGLNFGMSEKWPEFIDWIHSAVDELMGIFSSIKEGMYAVGADAVSGFLEGVSSLWGTLEETAASMRSVFDSVQGMAESSKGKTGKSDNKINFSDTSKAKFEKIGNYKVADFSPKEKSWQEKMSGGHFVKASRQVSDDSVSKDLMNGISIGVADAVNKVLVPALENERNLNVSLKGDAGKIFSLVQENAQKYKTITGNSAF